MVKISLSLPCKDKPKLDLLAPVTHAMMVVLGADIRGGCTAFIADTDTNTSSCCSRWTTTATALLAARCSATRRPSRASESLDNMTPSFEVL